MSVPTLSPPAPEWVSCGTCRGLTYGPRFDRDLRVCPGCGHHSRLTAGQRIEQLLDPGSVRPLEPPTVSEDPLGFVDSHPYPDRLRAARGSTGLVEAVTCVTGTLMGHPLVAAVMDFRFLGGSLGVGVGAAITAAADTARDIRSPLLLVTASGGARMQEGTLALMQMAKTSQAMAELDEAGILTICLVTDPTYGGVAASFATLGDVVVAEPGARIGFAGRRVIEQTIGHALPEGFQTAEFLLTRGLLDAVVPRSALRPTLARLLAAGTPVGGTPAATRIRLVRDPAELPVREAADVVAAARHPQRPTTLDYLVQVFDDFLELRGDRASGDCPAIVGGIGRLDGRPVVVIGSQKGRDTAERVQRNFGMALPEGYRKAARLMRLAAKLGLPVVTLVDTPGAHPGVDAEERGQAWVIAETIRLMSRLPVPVVAVVTGEGGSGGALALAVADRVLACAGAMYSVISPEGCAAILWKDPAAAPRAAAALQIGSRDLLRHGIVDAVVPEPPDGAHEDPVTAADLLRAALIESLQEIAAVAATDLVAGRRRRFRRFGTEESRWA
ncbi:acetyl-CoA carboxylase carboxyltransferase subunit alpha [Micromonospora sp. WMMA1363]|uniref:acetyl-CoA carboxylase carboxyltransferase subunit alpha n=1 Tax=Micromonospora sp. WMMA1363 TaxID=3053985 RepID=UPI00259C78E6|nr:acetyl-CoA carboxylase carboxyltransferase subunit alpha [Micromonospora sp. WMMA1363]MDM4718191.1 acetyl-CoA carboxylase carboxyltransferase subunit alpha [Micromonospora sp. WMMA1363]